MLIAIILKLPLNGEERGVTYRKTGRTACVKALRGSGLELSPQDCGAVGGGKDRLLLET